jgi:uncharacterized protein YyaL (SSP411 family)
MIGALARMARVRHGLGADRRMGAAPHLEAAQRAASFVKGHLWQSGSNTLLRRYRDGHAEIPGYAEDYAFLIFGLLELFQADSDPAWLEWATTLQRRQDELFWDEASGGWFSTDGRDPSVLLRMKEEYDGAEPTASSMTVLNLMVLSHLIEDPIWRERVDRTLRLFGSRLEKMGRSVPMMAAALSAYTAGILQIVIVEGDRQHETCRTGGPEELRRAIALRYLPFATVLEVDDRDPARRQALAHTLPFIAAMRPVEGMTAAYVCRNFTCRAPVTTVEALVQDLEIAL